MAGVKEGRGGRVLQRPSTKELLIVTAERLFGRFGIDGVSLREIATAAGQSNNNVVQYHFGDKAGLVAAILEARVQALEPLRAALLADLPAAGESLPRELLRVLWQPILSIRDDDGMHTFGRFLLQQLLQSRLAPHPIHRFLGSTEAPDAAAPPPAYVTATRRLRAHYRALPEAVLNDRLRSLSLMFLATLVEHDNARFGLDEPDAGSFALEPVLDMALAALGAAVST